MRPDLAPGPTCLLEFVVKEEVTSGYAIAAPAAVEA
jgi:hypothetical protein